MDRLWDSWTRKQQKKGLPILPQGKDLELLANEPFLFFVREDGNYVLDGKAGDYFSMDRFGYDYEQPADEARVAVAAAKPAPAVKGTMKAGLASVILPAAPRLAANAPARPLVALITVPRSADPSSARQFDVLVNAPPDVTEVSADSPYYGGTVSFFGPAMAGMAHEATFAVPLSPTLKALSAPTPAKGVKAGTLLEIRLAPSSAKDKPAPTLKAVSVQRL